MEKEGKGPGMWEVEVREVMDEEEEAGTPVRGYECQDGWTSTVSLLWY